MATTTKKTAQKAAKAAQKSKTTKSKSTKATKPKAKKSFDTGKIYIKVSFNNTIVTITDDKGNVVAWASAGSLGFSGPKKATPFAAQKVISTIAEKITKTGPFNVEVIVSGVSIGRDSAIRSLINHGFNIISLKDITPVPHNGPKPPKPRRV